jgi:hypothetical protein
MNQIPSNHADGSDTRFALQSVCLELTKPSARKACIAGSFNDWNPCATPMLPLGDGKWAKELMLPPGRYEYRFVVDGQWEDDPQTTELIPNVFGTANAVLVVAAAGLPLRSPHMPRPASSPGVAARLSRRTTRSRQPKPMRSSLPTTLFRQAALAQLSTGEAVEPMTATTHCR